MTILRTLAPPFFVFFIVVACSTATTIPKEPLSEIPAGATTRFIFTTSGSNAEAYLTRNIATDDLEGQQVFESVLKHKEERIGC